MTLLPRLALTTVTLLAAGTLVGCGGPTTESEVCSAYSDLGTEIGSTTGVPGFDNDLFDAAGELGDVASRYEEDAAVQSDGETLKDIGDSDSTSVAELISASTSIAALCGSSIG